MKLSMILHQWEVIAIMLLELIQTLLTRSQIIILVGNAPEVGGVWKTIKGVADAHHSFTAIYVAGKADEASLVQG
jgi:hypothetical protein